MVTSSSTTHSYGPSPAQILDLYSPKRRVTGSPIVVNVHGGAWITGDKSLCEASSTELARRGMTVANLNYRQGEPDPLDWTVPDILAALEWVQSADGPAASVLGPVAGRPVILTGDSSGAHAALLSAAAIVNPDLLRLWRPEQVPRHPVRVDALVLYSGALCVKRLLVPAGHEHSERFAGYCTSMSGGMSGRSRDQRLAAIDPANWISPLLPPLLAFSSSSDFFHESTETYVRKAQDAGQDATLVDFDSDHPACTHSWQLDPTLAESQETYDLTTAFAKTVKVGERRLGAAPIPLGGTRS